MNTDDIPQERGRRLAWLLTIWQLKEPVVTGIVEARGNAFCLRNVRRPDGVPLEYPNYMSLPIRSLLSEKGIYLRKDAQLYKGQFVSVKFDLAKEIECEKYENPVYLEGKTHTLTSLKTIPLQNLYIDNDDNVLLDRSIFDCFLREQTPLVESQLADGRREAKELKDSLETAHDQLDRLLSDQKETALQLVHLEKEVELKENETSERLAQLEQEEVGKRQLLIEETARLREEKKTMDLELKRLRTYAETEVKRLRRFDLITEEIESNLINDPVIKDDKSNPQHDFDEYLGGRFPELVAAVQAYLYNEKIYYRRHVLEDFISLLRTHDFIILAGTSGTGKTLLVKSVSEAIGAKHRIIPVKPNWTSTEDLMGYYNPIQKAFLPTEFYDALFEASENKDCLYLICLDEMNLAHVEHYFADFLSKLEDRRKVPILRFYSSDEEEHVLSEVTNFMKILRRVEGDAGKDVVFTDFMVNDEMNRQFKALLGASDAETPLSLHARVRRLICNSLSRPSELSIPPNVRFIGAINMDETTHFLSPKVLDRAHVIKFSNPFLYHWDRIKEEFGEASPVIVNVSTEQFKSPRQPYPEHDPGSFVAATLKAWSLEYLSPLGLDIGFRTLKQATLYHKMLSEVVGIQDGISQDILDKLALNNILLHKILPRLSFEGKSPPDLILDEEQHNKMPASKEDLVRQFQRDIDRSLQGISLLPGRIPPLNASKELERLILKAEANEWVFNYWI